MCVLKNLFSGGKSSRPETPAPAPLIPAPSDERVTAAEDAARNKARRRRGFSEQILTEGLDASPANVARKILTGE